MKKKWEERCGDKMEILEKIKKMEEERGEWEEGWRKKEKRGESDTKG